ncbi:MAG: site-specific integrase [Aeromicrobium sp.]|nr:site-specific integrase [Aeromicrobium sp.]
MARTEAETRALTRAIEKRRKAGRANFGTIDLLPSGRLRARYVGPDERRYSAPHTFDNLMDADAYLATIRQQMTQDTWLSPEQKKRAERAATVAGITANALFEEYLDEGDLKQRTIDLYRYQWRRFIEESIGTQPVADRPLPMSPAGGRGSLPQSVNANGSRTFCERFSGWHWSGG